jgi:hypothetical protein
MEEKTACCGLNCLECEAYRATAANDDAMRAEVAKKWSEQYQGDIKPEHINCKGCHSKESVFDFCTKCTLRLCCHGKSHENCAKCQDFSTCNTLSDYSKFIPQGRAKLDSIRDSQK